MQTDGTGYDICHPEMVLVGRRAAVVGLVPDPTQVLFERTVTLDLLHVIRLEPLPVPAGPNGGPAG